MKILFLYTEVMGYMLSTIKELVALGAQVILIEDDVNKKTPFCIPDTLGVRVFPFSSIGFNLLEKITIDFDPDITYVSGWVNHSYLRIARSLRKKRKIVVTGLDNQWRSSIRQHMAVVFSRLGIGKLFFSHVWIPGYYQHDFAYRLGYRRGEIIYNIYSADLNHYETAFHSRTNKNLERLPHRFIFIGRLIESKGLTDLIEAWRNVGEDRLDWELEIIGNGPLKDTLSDMPGIRVIDFKQPSEILTHYIDSGCAIIPSRSEPWGVVVHEFAASGLPLIVSDAVGSCPIFLIDGYNGFSFKSSSIISLSNAIKKIVGLPDWKLYQMGVNSNRISHTITPILSAQSLMSLLKKQTYL